MAGPPLATGMSDYGHDSVTRYQPEVWSGLLVEKFYKATVFSEIANTEYEGEITAFGQAVVIRTVPDVVVADYTVGGGLGTAQRPASAAVQLAINEAKYFNVGLNLVQQRQADIDLSSVFNDEGLIQLQIAADTDMLQTIQSQVSSDNTGATSGLDSNDIDLGSTSDPLDLVSESAAAGETNVLDFFVDCGTVLDEQSVSPYGRWMVIPPWLKGLVMKSPLKIASLAGDGQSIVRNGRIGEIAGFMIYESRNLLRTTSGASTTSFNVMFGHSAGLTFAAQILENRLIVDQNDFGYLLQGLLVFGYKVIEGKYIGSAYVRKSIL